MVYNFSGRDNVSSNCGSKKLKLNSIINSTIIHLTGDTLGLHDKIMRRFVCFLYKVWLTIFYNGSYNDKRFNKFQEQEVIFRRNY